MPLADLRPFVVTGTARSGTMFTAAVLAGLGLHVGHEDVFGPRSRSFDGWHGRHGDVSWLAAPFLGDVGDALVMHQLRHPLRVVRSLVGMRFMADRSWLFLTGDDLYTRTKWRVRERLMAAGHVPASDHGPRGHRVYRDFLDSFEPGLWELPTEPERALAYWVRWTRRIRAYAESTAYRSHHLERLDAELLSGLLGEIGLTVAPQHVQLAMDKVPTDLNSRRVAGGLGWDDLPSGPLRRAAEELAESLGYAASDPARLPRTEVR
jgi:hypothetical protein